MRVQYNILNLKHSDIEIVVSLAPKYLLAFV